MLTSNQRSKHRTNTSTSTNEPSSRKTTTDKLAGTEDRSSDSDGLACYTASLGSEGGGDLVTEQVAAHEETGLRRRLESRD
jgi:hypothetical protein